MGVHVVEAFLDRVCEFLDDLRVFFDIAFLSAVGGVGHISGVFSERRDHIAVSFLLQGCGEWFEFNGVVRIIAGEGRGGETEADALVDGEILCGIDAVLL